VDLWADKTREPGDLIAEVVRDALAAQLSKPLAGLEALKRIKKAGARGEWAGFKAELGFELETVGQPDGTTLTKAFEALRRRAKRPIVLIIDEAQHALASERGAETLFALKAARDALNLSASKPQLAILATGSARAKIADLVSRTNQAFYGASTETFPPLGEDFVSAFAHAVLSHRISSKQMPNAEQLLRAFRSVGSRPEDLKRALRDALIRPEEDLGEAIIAAADEQRNRTRVELRKQLAVLSDLQRSILRRMVEVGDDSPLFSKEALTFYRTALRDRELSSLTVQKAIDGLVANGFVWRSARGVYALDDTIVAELLIDERLQDVL
jgi:hypothetical protein